MLKQRMCQAARSASASSDASGATFSCVGCHGDRHLAWRAWCLLLILYAINASFRGKLVTKGGKDSERIFQARDAFRRDDQFNFQTDRSGLICCDALEWNDIKLNRHARACRGHPHLKLAGTISAASRFQRCGPASSGIVSISISSSSSG